jgi:hypothetical protein
MNWPPHLPQNCPPQDAQDASGEVYRLATNNPPQVDDFRSWREENPDKDLSQGITECQACGLSVYRKKEEILSVINKIPRFRKSKPALGVLDPSLGKILATPSKNGNSHHTWWISSGTQPWTIFHIADVD